VFGSSAVKLLNGPLGESLAREGNAVVGPRKRDRVGRVAVDVGVGHTLRHRAGGREGHVLALAVTPIDADRGPATSAGLASVTVPLRVTEPPSLIRRQRAERNRCEDRMHLRRMRLRPRVTRQAPWPVPAEASPRVYRPAFDADCNSLVIDVARDQGVRWALLSLINSL
jgi:hypothetical protein